MVVGLTGGIGSGKTTVLKMFQSLGAICFVADVEAKKLMTNNKELKQNIINLLGEEAYIKDSLNRTYIASKVFTNKEKLKALNALVHPKVKESFLEFKSNYSKEIIIYESAILYESGTENLCNFIILVTANLEERIKRVLLRDKTTRAEIMQRINNQQNEKEKVKKATFIIRNSNLKATLQQVKTIYSILERIHKNKIFLI